LPFGAPFSAEVPSEGAYGTVKVYAKVKVEDMSAFEWIRIGLCDSSTNVSQSNAYNLTDDTWRVLEHTETDLDGWDTANLRIVLIFKSNSELTADEDNIVYLEWMMVGLSSFS
jgi:hypothetical protein